MTRSIWGLMFVVLYLFNNRDKLSFTEMIQYKATLEFVKDATLFEMGHNVMTKNMLH